MDRETRQSNAQNRLTDTIVEARKLHQAMAIEQCNHEPEAVNRGAISADSKKQYIDARKNDDLWAALDALFHITTGYTVDELNDDGTVPEDDDELL
jgi:hypothetical protein